MNSNNVKLLLVLLIVALIAAPYYFVIMPLMEKNEAIEKEITALQAEKSRLEAHVAHVDEYQQGVREYAEQIGVLLTPYPKSLPQEAAILFLDRTERHIPMRLDSAGFSARATEEVTRAKALPEGEEGVATTPAADDGAASAGLLMGTPLTSIKGDLTLSYQAEYKEFKDFLAFIRSYPERMLITRLSANFGKERSRVEGTLSLTMYAIDGEGRPEVEVVNPGFDTGSRNIFIPAPGEPSIPQAIGGE